MLLADNSWDDRLSVMGTAVDPPRVSICGPSLLPQVPVACTEDVLEVMDRGQRNRAVAETRMNDRSSRSHQVGV